MSSDHRKVDGSGSTRSCEYISYAATSSSSSSSTSTSYADCKLKRIAACSSKALVKKRRTFQKNDSSWISTNKLTKDGIIHLFRTANISFSDYEFLVPSNRQRANNPPEGYITVYAEQIDAGLRFPLHGFVVEVCNSIKLSPAQLVPDAHCLVVGFILCAKLYGIPLAVDSFFSLFSVQPSHGEEKMFRFVPPKGKDLNFLFCTHRCTNSWQMGFFFLRPKGKIWNCITTWSRTYSTPPSNPGSVKLAIDNGILCHRFHAIKLIRKELLVHGGIESGVPSTELTFRYLMHEAAVTKFELHPEDRPARVTTKVRVHVCSTSSSSAAGTASPTQQSSKQPENHQTSPSTKLPEPVPLLPHVLALHQAIESSYVPKESYQKLASELECAKARIQELEQELKLSKAKGADFENRTSHSIKAIKSLLEEMQPMNSS